jgi:hypothetical protein
VDADPVVSKSLLEVEAPAPPEHPQLLGRVQTLLQRAARFVRVRENFMFLLCALVDFALHSRSFTDFGPCRRTSRSGRLPSGAVRAFHYLFD